MNSSDESIYNRIEEERQNDRLSQELNNHNWLINKIVTNEPGLKENIKDESDFKVKMNKTRKCSEDSKPVGKKQPVSQLDRSDNEKIQ